MAAESLDDLFGKLKLTGKKPRSINEFLQDLTIDFPDIVSASVVKNANVRSYLVVSKG